jgi:hypothetical protein
MIDSMTRQRMHIHRSAGLTHRRIAEVTQTSERTVKRVLQEDCPSPEEVLKGRVSRPHGGRPATGGPQVRLKYLGAYVNRTAVSPGRVTSECRHGDRDPRVAIQSQGGSALGSSTQPGGHHRRMMP